MEPYIPGLVSVIIPTYNIEHGRLEEPFPLMKYIQIYLLCAIILYFIGPIVWKTKMTLLTFLLVLIYQGMLYLGYSYGRRKRLKRNISKIFTAEWYTQHYIMFACIVIITKTLLIFRVAFLYGFSSIFDLITAAFTSGSSIYMADQLVSSGSQMFGGSALSLAVALLGPITVSFIPLTVILFKKLSLKLRLLGIIAIVITTISGLVFGTTEGYFEPVLYLVAGFLLRKNPNGKIKKTQKKRHAILLIIGVIVIISLFNVVMSDRNGTYYTFRQMGENTVVTDTWLYSVTPDNLKILLIWLTFYVCQGYYGMSLALTSKWTPLFGMGFSSYLRTNIEGILGIDLASLTLMAGTSQYGWKYGVNWHTAYTWFASDIWWLGVSVLMFSVGWLLARVYYDAYYNQNPVAVGLFALLLMMMIFLPANNKVFANSDTFFAFFFYLFALAISKKQYIST